MKQRHDFSKGERGKFYQPDPKIIPPVHLETKALEYLAARAKARGIPLSELVNELLRKDIDLIEAGR